MEFPGTPRQSYPEVESQSRWQSWQKQSLEQLKKLKCDLRNVEWRSPSQEFSHIRESFSHIRESSQCMEKPIWAQVPRILIPQGMQLKGQCSFPEPWPERPWKLTKGRSGRLEKQSIHWSL